MLLISLRLYIPWPSVRRLSILLVLVVLALVGAGAALAQDAPEIRAKAALVADSEGNLLYADDADRRVAIASITKIMTALVTLDRIRPKAVVKIGALAPSVGESTFSLQPGERLRVRELLTAALVQSANDAAYALANHVGRGNVERFVRWMNERAADLGLEQTHYVRPDGLDTKGHYSSAIDTLTLAREAMKQKLIREIVRTRSGVVAGRRLYVWNDLLRTYPGAIGIKTGHTDLAGWSEVAAARRDGITLYAVLLGGPTRARRNHDLAALLDWGFGHYGSVRVIAGGRTYATAGVPYSDDRVELLAETSARASVRLGRPLVERVVAPSQLEPPIGLGEAVGEVRIYDGDKLIAKRPLVASQAVGEPGFGKRVSWYAGRALDEAGEILGSLSPF
jgi:D-alanyl-D-alanine carboxypeptidase (penicillin-binding protein 5/6)